MDRNGLTLKLLLLFFLLLKSEICEGIGDDCEVTFDFDTPSVMLVAGSNASVTCEASCSHDYEDSQVFWTDDRGSRILPYPNRVFAVPYNQGLRNNLLIIGADDNTKGVYVCSLHIGSQLVRRKAFDLVVFGVHSERVDYHFPRHTGPRRGDIIPDEETDVYRPVRSVRLSRHSRRLRRSSSGWGNHMEGDKPRTSLSPPFKTDTSLLHDPLAGDTPRSFAAPRNFSSRTQAPAETPSHPLSTARLADVLNTQRTRSRSTPQAHSSTDSFKATRSPTIALAPTNSDSQARTTMYPRNSLASTTTDFLASTTKDPLESTTTGSLTSSTTDVLASTTKDPLESTTTGSLTSSTTDFLASTSTDVLPATSTDSLASPSAASVSSTDLPAKSSAQTHPSGKAGLPEAQAGQTDCPEDKNEGDSTFGRYGVLACSISLAVAFLLFYAILMLIFLPKIMARRTMDVQNKAKEKVSWGGSTYKKRNSDVLCDMALVSNNSGSPASTEKDNDNKLDITSHPEKTTLLDEDEAQSADNGNVSTFLLRQNSEMKKREEDTKETNSAPKEEVSQFSSHDASVAAQGNPSVVPEGKAENANTMSKEEIGNTTSHDVGDTMQECPSEKTKEKEKTEDASEIPK